jgi:hypothetical protein
VQHRLERLEVRQHVEPLKGGERAVARIADRVAHRDGAYGRARRGHERILGRRGPAGRLERGGGLPPDVRDQIGREQSAHEHVALRADPRPQGVGILEDVVGGTELLHATDDRATVSSDRRPRVRAA